MIVLWFRYLFSPSELLILQPMLICRQVNEAIFAIVLTEFAQRAIRHTVDCQHLVGALVDVAQLNELLQVVHLLHGKTRDAAVLGAGEHENDL